MAPRFQGRRPGNAGESGDFLVVCGCGSVLPRLEAWVPFLGRGLDPACHNLDLVRPNKEFKKKKKKECSGISGWILNRKRMLTEQLMESSESL